jgi:hypothetical protein
MSDTLAKVLGAGTGLAAIYGYLNPNDQNPVGFQGSIPQMTATREVLPGTNDPARRPGSAGQRYFTDVQYTPVSDQKMMNPEQMAAMDKWAQDLYLDLGLNLQPSSGASSEAGTFNLSPEQLAQLLANLYGSGSITAGDGTVMQRFQSGGVASIPRKGYYLGGPTDGMADEIPATIDGRQPAALSDGEFVIPADVVSHLGNGNSEAGAKQLYTMMDRVRQARTGMTDQGRKINPNKFLPK